MLIKANQSNGIGGIRTATVGIGLSCVQLISAALYSRVIGTAKLVVTHTRRGVDARRDTRYLVVFDDSGFKRNWSTRRPFEIV